MTVNIFCNKKASKLFILIVVCFVFFSCGSNGGDSSSSRGETGATLQGNIKSVTVNTVQLADAGDITVSIGDLKATTDEEGNFIIENIPTGDQVIQFSIPTGDQVFQIEEEEFSAFFDLFVLEEQEVIELRDLEINDEKVIAEYTGTWTGTGGSTEEGSHGDDLPLIMTLTIPPNSNGVDTEHSIIKFGEGAPEEDAPSTWEVEGSISWNPAEGKNQIVGNFWLVQSIPHSECAADAHFSGLFERNSLDGDFTEFNVPEGCIDPDKEDDDGLREGVFHFDKL
ncbi:MAG: hypothetical protein P8Y38_00160 [Deltaproteobacteria bacterium]